jgi:hypothetical protein
MPALLALKGADFQSIGRMWRPSSQMRIAAALLTAKRRNKFVILHNKGMLFHTRPCPNAASVNAEPAHHPRRQLRTPPSSDKATMIRTEDGK